MDEIDKILENYIKPELELPLEKKFEIANFNNKIEKCNKEQAIKLAKLTFECMIVNQYNMLELLKHKWFSGH